MNDPAYNGAKTVNPKTIIFSSPHDPTSKPKARFITIKSTLGGQFSLTQIEIYDYRGQLIKPVTVFSNPPQNTAQIAAGLFDGNNQTPTLEMSKTT